MLQILCYYMYYHNLCYCKHLLCKQNEYAKIDSFIWALFEHVLLFDYYMIASIVYCNMFLRNEAIYGTEWKRIPIFTYQWLATWLTINNKAAKLNVPRTNLVIIPFWFLTRSMIPFCNIRIYIGKIFIFSIVILIKRNSTKKFSG